MIGRLPALVFLACGAGSSALAQVSVSIPEFGTVRAGATAKLEWRGLPEEADELELLLSIEEHELPIRLTSELSPRAGTLLWRVPNLPSRRARLTIRFGIEGEEIESVPSDVFEIRPSRDEPLASVVFRDGEWWAERKSESPLAGLRSDAPSRGRIQEERESPPCSGSSSTPLLSGRHRPPLDPAVTRSRTLFAAPGASLPRRPLEVPARI
ncbi:MAG TPA: hypothetical protein VKG01_15990 [Thermoanaerobaculia bacterium]|nr:hypothetical protein [Thermoanaerobaculia bacterium]